MCTEYPETDARKGDWTQRVPAGHVQEEVDGAVLTREPVDVS